MSKQSHARIDFAAPGVPPGGLAWDGFERVLETRELAAVPALVQELADWQAGGGYAVGLISYEAAPAFDPALTVRPPEPDGPPLLWFGLSRQAPAAPSDAEHGPYDFRELQPEMDAAAYAAAFAGIHQQLVDGETYQVNFTFPKSGHFDGDPAALYADLRRAQAAPYCAHIATPDWQVLSVSPELFFELDGRRIRTRPMKGTRRRGPDAETDAALAADLTACAKERAENVMIVDLLRNDLGRVCELGSIRPTQLCTLERYPTVWQLTSEIEGQLRQDVGLLDILRALFPCGSVTGAPKVRTMQIIADREIAPRGVYCGSIAYLQPDGRTTLNVAIRTLTIQRDGRARYPVGSGLVVDGEAATEYAECLAKSAVTRVLNRPRDFELRETLLWQPGSGFQRLDRHLDRLARGADYFDFAMDPERIVDAMNGAATAWAGPKRVALSLARDGAVRVEAVDFDGTPTSAKAGIWSGRVDSQDPFLRHKTTHRPLYTAAFDARGEADDMILLNERDEVTEFTRANIAVKLDGVWYTPPVSGGLLPGCLRAERLATGELTERVITLADLRRADAIQAYNSLRGSWPVELI